MATGLKEFLTSLAHAADTGEIITVAKRYFDSAGAQLLLPPFGLCPSGDNGGGEAADHALIIEFGPGQGHYAPRFGAGIVVRFSDGGFEELNDTRLNELCIAAYAAHQRLSDAATEASARERAQLAFAALSRRELECLDWLAQGLRVEEIAARMKIKTVTVNFHIRNAKAKLGAATREQAIAAAVACGVIAVTLPSLEGWQAGNRRQVASE